VAKWQSGKVLCLYSATLQLCKHHFANQLRIIQRDYILNTNQFDLKETIIDPDNDNRWLGLLRLLTGYRLVYAGAIIAVGLAALANTGIYLLIGRFVDDVLPLENSGYLLPLYAIAVVAIAALQGLFSFIGGRGAALVAEKITQRLRNYLYDHLQRLSFSQHDRAKTGERLSRATSDVDAIRKVIAEQAIGFGRIFFRFSVSFSALLWLNPRLAFYSIIVLPILAITSVIFFKQIEKRYEAFQKQESKLTTRLQESLSGVRVVRAFARQTFETKRFGVENEEKWRQGLRLTRAHASFWPTTDFLSGFQLVLSLFVAGTMVLDGDISQGEFIASIGLVNQLIWPVRNVGRVLAEIGMGMVSFGRITDILKHDREPLRDANSITPPDTLYGDIEFNNVTFAYVGDGKTEMPTVLHNISFRVKAGQTVALLGSTGSGKTSLVNLLPRFYDYHEGSITLDGSELSRYPRDFLREQIGIVMQEPILFAASIRDNIAYGARRDVSEAEIFAAAQAADVHDVILGFPQGYDTKVGERGVTLSGGQKQRL
ncbi:MAG TPA: ABC transporter ATP-binding protein, partial [Anaerolineae bacterium]|nr:ABC transporter ATP-binding protein [Anaerolineae bacterium]